MNTLGKAADAKVAGIYDDGILVIVSDQQYFVPFDEYKEFASASSQDIFNVICDNCMVKWPSLGLEIRLRDIRVRTPELLFTYPKVSQYVYLSILIIGIILVGFSGSAAIFKNTTADQIIYAWIMFVIFSSIEVYLLFGYSIMRQSIFIDDHGISEIARSGSRYTIQWNDIVRIKECKVDNIIKITSDKNKAIRLYQSINGFENIIYILTTKTGLKIE